VFKVGLAYTGVFTTPHASLFDAPLRGRDGVHDRARPTPCPWPGAGAGAITAGSHRLQLDAAPLTETWTGTWDTPETGKYQGVVLVRFSGQDRAVPPNLGWQTVAPYLDSMPPWLAVHYPASGYMQVISDVVAGGKTEPFSTVYVTATYLTAIQTVSTVALENGDWMATLENMGDGEYTLTVRAVDRAGNLSQPVVVQAVVDSTGPAVSQVAYEPRRYVQSAHGIELRALLDDLTGVDWAYVTVENLPGAGNTWGGEMTGPPEGGWYTVSPVLSGTIEGRKPFTITAQDWLGNASVYSTGETYFIVDDTAPQCDAQALDASGGTFLYLPEQAPLRLYYSSHSSGSLQVSASFDDANPPLPDSDVAGLEAITFPNIFAFTTRIHDLDGEVAATRVQPYTVNGVEQPVNNQVSAADRAGNPGACGTFSLIWDEAPPTHGYALLGLDQGTHTYLVSQLGPLYYGPGASGTLTTRLTASEDLDLEGTQSGIWYTAFPDLFGLGVLNNDTPDPNHGWYERDYPITWVGGPHGLFSLDATDRVGNFNPASFLVLRDEEAPELLNQTLTADGAHVYPTTPTTLLYYGPDASGTLNVGVTANDRPLSGGYDGSGVHHVTFPDLFTAGMSDTSYPYSRGYTINDSPAVSGTHTLGATDNVGNQVSGLAPFTILWDDDAPLLSDRTVTAVGTNVYPNNTPTEVLYYGPNTGGSLTIAVTADDPTITLDGQVYNGSGVLSVTFPTLFTRDRGHLAHSRVYTLNNTAGVSGTYDRCYDNVAIASNVLPFTILLDDVSPNLPSQILGVSGSYLYLTTSPTRLYYGPSSNGTLSINATASDPALNDDYAGSGVQYVTFPDLFDDGEQDDYSGPYQRDYSIEGSATTTGTFALDVTDNVSNQASGPQIQIIKDQTEPESLSLVVPDTIQPLTFPVSWGATDGQSGVASYEARYSTNGVDWYTWYSGADTQRIFEAPGPGTYWFQMRATDRVGNVSDWLVSDPVTVDGEGPTTTISAPSPARLEFVVSWIGDDGGGSGVRDYDVQYKIGSGGQWQNWRTDTTETEYTYTGGQPGQTYYFQARATDQVGNEGDWSASLEVIVDGAPPTAALVLPPAPGLLFSVAWSGDDGNGVGVENYDVEYSTDGGNTWIPWLTDTTLTEAQFAAAAGATLWFKVRATDFNGNIGEAQQSVVVYDVVKYYTFGAQRVAMRQCNDDGCADLCTCTATTWAASAW
jgi:hypothetical protein